MTNTPHHVAIIMDGNGRWANQRGLPRFKGHEEGGKRIEDIIRAAPKFGIKYLTLYAFSKENWQRPKREIDFLMNLLSEYLDRKREEMEKQNMIFRVIGAIEDLPEKVQKKIARNVEESKHHTGTIVTFALSYSSRYEITQACQKVAAKVQEGNLSIPEINEDTISKHLYTADMPDPDLLVRTSGEVRVSNYLLWQISYAELYITEKLWPEFDEGELEKAVVEYGRRERRYGRSEVVK